MSSYQDRRRMERFDLNLPANVSYPGDDDRPDALELITSDICAGGAFFQTEKPLPLNTPVNIELILPLDKIKTIESPKARIKLSGAVIRCTESGMAVSFNKKFQIEEV